MKKDRIHIYEMESYKHASEEQRNSMRICKIRYFDLEGLPSREVKEILENEMMNAASLRVPLSIDIEQGASWYEAK